MGEKNVSHMTPFFVSRVRAFIMTEPTLTNMSRASLLIAKQSEEARMCESETIISAGTGTDPSMARS